MTSVIGTATAADGTRLRTRHWVLANPEMEPVASVLIVHGLLEHSGRYEHVGEQLASEGLEVHAFDLRGSGASAGRRGHVEAFDAFYSDVAERLDAVRAVVQGRPVVLYGHSLGGLIVLGYVLRIAAARGAAPGGGGEPERSVAGRPLPDFLVLSAPGLESTIPVWRIQLAKVLGRIMPTLSIPNPIAGPLRSSDPSVGERFDADPLNLHAITTAFGAASIAEQAWVRSSIAGLDLPTLVVHGADDALVPARASAPLGDLPSVTRRTFPGIRHELHNEPTGPAIVAEVIAWIREQVIAAAR